MAINTQVPVTDILQSPTSMTHTLGNLVEAALPSSIEGQVVVGGLTGWYVEHEKTTPLGNICITAALVLLQPYRTLWKAYMLWVCNPLTILLRWLVVLHTMTQYTEMSDIERTLIFKKRILLFSEQGLLQEYITLNYIIVIMQVGWLCCDEDR